MYSPQEIATGKARVFVPQENRRTRHAEGYNKFYIYDIRLSTSRKYDGVKNHMKKTILYISPGPVYRPRLDSYQDEYRRLSQKYTGYIFTTSSAEEEFSIDGFRYSSMLTDQSMRANLKFLFFCIRRAKALKKQKITVDLVVTYDPLKTGLIGIIVSRILRAKLAVRVNGVYTSPAEWVDEKDTLKVKVKKNLYPLIMRVVLKRADGIKLLFRNQIDSFRNILGAKVIRTFPNYVDIDSFQNMGENKEVLFVGFPFKRKGADIIIEAFKTIEHKYPDWRLKILGWYPDTALLYDAIGDDQQIFHKKPVHHNEMPKEIGECSVLVLPSRSEAMGRVLVEAMAAGKPRIGANVDGIPTVINDGLDGLLFEPGNVADLGEKLERLMSDPDLRKRLGSNASVRAKKEFSKDVYIENVSLFYDDVINS